MAALSFDAESPIRLGSPPLSSSPLSSPTSRWCSNFRFDARFKPPGHLMSGVANRLHRAHLLDTFTSFNSEPSLPSKSSSDQTSNRSRFHPYPKQRGTPPLEFRKTLSGMHLDGRRAKDIFYRGMGCLSDNCLVDAVYAKHASRELERHRILATSWEIEEAERFLRFLQGVQESNLLRRSLATDELEFFKSMLADRGILEFQDDIRSGKCLLQEKKNHISEIDQQIGQLEEQASVRGIGTPYESSSDSGAVTHQKCLVART
ncbi:hypothetical protein BJ138DRAFT_1120449 [Hygrophoropsis aurantiaca]|uniref:Uncharacterized protein n=1 Tax=Hygrophoropsis aurantiaca TaxID=72124 RepID=A0ACB7ZQE7_9AGAM|nr:hypothetical protein BJ138DRAFT_1120449 [Hygrophoropsis aurantiaca]